MHKVKMLKDVLGSRDGVKVEKFLEGSEHEISDGLLNDFISMGAVECLEIDVIEEEVKEEDLKELEEVDFEEVKAEPVKPAKGKK